VHRSPDDATEVILWVNAATTVLAQRQALLKGGPAGVFNPTNAHVESVAWTPRCGIYTAHDVTELRYLADCFTSAAEDGFTVLDLAHHTATAGAHP
jgi:hypothetical protein